MTMVKTLVALATERMLLKTSGPTFLRGIEFMYAAGLAPDRLSVMMTSSHKYVLQFHSKCDIRPFAANYPNFGRVLRGIVHVREWRIKSIEFVNVAFYMRDVDNLERAVEKLGVELVLLRNCTYPGVQRGDEAVKFLSALNRKKQAVVCEYGDDRLKHRIGRRSSGNRTRRVSRNGNQEVVVPPQEAAEIVVAPLPPNVPAPAVAQPIGPQEAQLNNEPPAVPEPLNVQPAPLQNPAPVMNNRDNGWQQPQMPQAGVAPGYVAPEPVAQEAGLVPPAAPVAAPAAPAAGQGFPARGAPGQVVVGAHVYEFRAVNVPVADNIPTVQNLSHLLHVLSENVTQDVRVIVLPPEYRGGPLPGPIQVIPNNQMYRQPYGQPAPMVGGAPMPPPLPLGIGQLNSRGVAEMNYGNRVGGSGMQPEYMHQVYPPPQQHLPLRPQPQWNYHVTTSPAGQMPLPRHMMAPAQVPMFGVAVNEPQVQQMGRNGDDSNDSTDREEMYDAEQQRNDALRDLVADPEAQPNFAPVEAQAVDLDMLEEEAEEEEEEEEEDEEDDEVMEGVEQQYIVEHGPVLH